MFENPGQKNTYKINFHQANTYGLIFPKTDSRLSSFEWIKHFDGYNNLVPISFDILIEIQLDLLKLERKLIKLKAFV